MKSVKHNKVSGFAAKAFAFTFAFGLAACSEAEKPRDPETPPTSEADPLKEVSFVIDSKGNIDIKNPGNTRVEDCSLDPQAKDRCSIFDKKIQVENLETMTFIRFKGSDCVMIGFASRARLVCVP